MSLRAVSHPSDVSFQDSHIVRWTGKVKHFACESAPLSLKFANDPRIRWRVKDREFRLNPTTLFVLDHGEPYEVHVEFGKEVSAAGIFFSEEVAAMLEAYRPILPRIVSTNEANSEFMYSVLSAEPSPGLDEYLLAEAVDLVRDCYLALEVQKESLDLKRELTSTEIMSALFRARDLILSSSDSPLSLEMLAREAALSKFHFHRLFSAAFGQTCHQYLESTRLERAMNLLNSTDDAVESVAMQCGFLSGRAMRMKFVRRFGITPTAMRARRNSQDQAPFRSNSRV